MRTWLILGIALLAGCESDFDKCMNTEVRKAEQMLGLDEELAHAEVLSELKAWVEAMWQFEDQSIENSENNVPEEEIEALELSQCKEIMGSLQVDCEALLALREDDGLFAYHVQYDEHVSQDVAKGNIRYGDWDARLAQIEEVMETSRGVLAEIREKAPLLAAEVCNAKGIYE